MPSLTTRSPSNITVFPLPRQKSQIFPLCLLPKPKKNHGNITISVIFLAAILGDLFDNRSKFGIMFPGYCFTLFKIINKQNAFSIPKHGCHDLSYFSTDSELWKQNHCETSCNSTSFWHPWPPRYLIRELKRLRSRGAKSGLYGGCLGHTHLNFCDKAATCQVMEVLALSDSHLFGLLKKQLRGHRCQTDAEVHEAVSRWFCSKSREFCAECMHLLITH